MIAALAGALVLALLPVPPLSGPVVDRAGALSQPERARLEELAKGARATKGGEGPQLAFLIVKSLEGEPIESYSIRVAEQWRLGSKQASNGLLFVVSLDDREVRIEVGGGIEGELTDAQAGRIIRETIVPAFRQGAYGAGLRAGAARALGHLGIDSPGAAPREAGREASPLEAFIVIALIVVIAIFGRRLGIPMGRGGFGGRGGGGGYRGGGGGFSGGGASGKW
ncbi:TPM domain-containing protein [Vulgatibacter incomptus]|uniref:Beta-propeller domains of methanol dehydrogenase type n=1 Tax=Vulgatibacter incomptus TaxID=1391653 RepID=A0A0K1PHN0_9BACT|nr:TPM domain-containing protein [Vulgatibacter incomptus]AKU92906.1 Beta-propeller domains of methanol dehydrogenase type [Vulgatibacter incomptus]